METSTAGLGERVSAPWHSRRLWSLWDIAMRNFLLLQYHLLLRQLIRETEGAEEKSKWASSGVPPRNALVEALSGGPTHIVTKDEVDNIRKLFNEIGDLSKDIELESTARRLWRPQMKLDYSISYADLNTELRVLSETIEDDLRGKWFYYYPQEKYKVVHDIKSNWGVAYEKFIDIRSDIYSAMDCYATGHSTACIFHLMRVMEFGVQRFGRKLSISLTKKTSQKLHDLSWHQILDGLNPQLAKMRVDTAARKLKHERYSAVQSYLYAVKDAWRNPTMHPRKKAYSDLEALDIINHVRAFMVGLAGLVK